MEHLCEAVTGLRSDANLSVGAGPIKVWQLWEQGELRTCTYRTFPPAGAAQAHALMESSQHIGKIILVP